jgi:hypothetical protein
MVMGKCAFAFSLMLPYANCVVAWNLMRFQRKKEMKKKDEKKDKE